MSLFFTSDTHFWHNNIIDYEQRPFADAELMNEVLIDHWNDVVKPEDTVHHIGDFCFANKEKTQAIYKRLNGLKYLVLGNHDLNRSTSWWESIFGADAVCHRTYLDKNDFTLIHDPAQIAEQHQGVFLHGHWHGKCKMKLGKNANQILINVGVDAWDYTPVSLEQISELIGTCKAALHAPDTHGNVRQ